jgi:hypothetical protein
MPTKFIVTPRPGQIVKVYFPAIKVDRGKKEYPVEFGIVIAVKKRAHINREIVLLKQSYVQYDLLEVDFFLDSTVCEFV